MDIHLHVGAHRTATTTFQHYLRGQRDWLEAQGIGFWGPWRIRKGMLNGLLEDDGADAVLKGAARVKVHLRGTRARGARALVVTEENVLGAIRGNVVAGRLYPQAAARVARVASALGEALDIHLTVRPLDVWWASVLAYHVARGGTVPDAQGLTRIAFAPRSWRHVITDIARACPSARLHVTRFDDCAARPDLLLASMLGQAVPQGAVDWANRSDPLTVLRLALHLRGADPAALPPGLGRWQPFDATQASALREAYADDLFWLRAGADGLADLTEFEDDGTRAGRTGPRLPFDNRGQSHDRYAGKLAGHR